MLEKRRNESRGNLAEKEGIQADEGDCSRRGLRLPPRAPYCSSFPRKPSTFNSAQNRRSFVSNTPDSRYYARVAGAAPFTAGITGGVVGGVAQAYATMGFCTCMKTAEITRSKQAASGIKPPSTWAVFADIYRKEGIAGINKGVNAVAIRQMTNWGSRFGLARLAEDGIRKVTGKEESQALNVYEKILASTFGGGLSAWNQPIEVIRVEMQSQKADPNRPAKLTVGTAAKYIYSQNGIKGLYRGVTPRIGLGIWQTICMVGLGDM